MQAQPSQTDPLAIIALMISALAAIFAFLQWLAGKRQAKAAENSTEAAIRSAAAAEASARAANIGIEIGQRAWLLVTDIKLNRATAITEPSITIIMTNVGCTPATHVRALTSISVAPQSDPEVDVPGPKYEQYYAIGNGKEMLLMATIRDAQQVVPAIIAGQSVFCIQGRVTYREVFGKEHETKFGFLFERERGGFLPTKHNDIN
jgi:hypothetical protein